MALRDPLSQDTSNRISARLDRVIDILFRRDMPWHPLRNSTSLMSPPPTSTWYSRDNFIFHHLLNQYPLAVENKIAAALPNEPFPTTKGLLSLLILCETFHEKVVLGGTQTLYNNPGIERYYQSSIIQGGFAPFANGLYRISYQELLNGLDQPYLRIKRLYDNLWKSIECLSVPAAVHAWNIGSPNDFSENLVIPPSGDIAFLLESNLDLWLAAIEDELLAIQNALLKAHQEARALLSRDLFNEILAMDPSNPQSIGDFNQRDAAWVAKRAESYQASFFTRQTGPGWWSWRPQVKSFHITVADPRDNHDQVLMLQKCNVVAWVEGYFSPNSSVRTTPLRGQIANDNRQQLSNISLNYYDQKSITVSLPGGGVAFTSELLFVSDDIVFNHPSAIANQHCIDIAGFPGESIRFSVENLPPQTLTIIMGDDDAEPQPHFTPIAEPNLTFLPIIPGTNNRGLSNQLYSVTYDPQRLNNTGPMRIYLGENNNQAIKGFAVVWHIQGNGFDESFYTTTNDDGIAKLNFSWQGQQKFYPAPDSVPVIDREMQPGHYTVDVWPADPIFGAFIERPLRFTLHLIAPTVINFTSANPNVNQREVLPRTLGSSPFLVKVELGRRHSLGVTGDSFTMNLSSGLDSTTVPMQRDPNHRHIFYSTQTIHPNTSILTDMGSNDIDVGDQTEITASGQLPGDSTTVSGSILYVADGNDPITPSQTGIDADIRYQTFILESALNEVAVAIQVGRDIVAAGNAVDGEADIVEHKYRLLQNARRFLHAPYETHQFNTPVLYYRNFVVGEYIKLIKEVGYHHNNRSISDVLGSAHVRLNGIFTGDPVIEGVDANETAIINSANHFFLHDINLQVLRTIQSYIAGGLNFIGTALVQFVLPIDSFKAVVFNETPDGFQTTFTERAIGLFDFLPFIPSIPRFRPVGALPNPGGTNFQLTKIGRAAQDLNHRIINGFTDIVGNPTLRRAFRVGDSDSLVPILRGPFLDETRAALAARLTPSSSVHQFLDNALAITQRKIDDAVDRMRQDHVELAQIQSELNALKARYQAGDRSATLRRQLSQKARRLSAKTMKIRTAKVKFIDHLIDRQRRFHRALGNASGANIPESVALDWFNGTPKRFPKAHDKIKGKTAWAHFEDDVMRHLNSGSSTPRYIPQTSIPLNTAYIGTYPASFSHIASGTVKAQTVVRPDFVDIAINMVEVKYYRFSEIAHDAAATQHRANILWESLQKGRRAQFDLLERSAAAGTSKQALWDQVKGLSFKVYTPEPVPPAIIARYRQDPLLANVEFLTLTPDVPHWVQ